MVYDELGSGMLYNDTLFSELYWTSISNLAKEMMNEYLEQDAHCISLLPKIKGRLGNELSVMAYLRLWDMCFRS